MRNDTIVWRQGGIGSHEFEIRGDILVVDGKLMRDLIDFWTVSIR
jgi:hypothetical protein